MSGGSFSYLGQKVRHGELPSEYQLGEMVAELRDRGEDDASEATNKILLAYEIIRQESRKLADIWEAAEMVCSGDWGKESIAEAVDRWKAEHR